MKLLLDELQINKTLKRITHEIIEQHNKLDNIVLVGVLTKGMPIAKILCANIKRFADVDIPLYALDVSGHRDDGVIKELKVNNLEIDQKDVILVDDVLFTGRTIRAAMDALIEFGRPKTIKLAILIDRGHRELPIKADYVGKNIPSSKLDRVLIDFDKMEVNLHQVE